MAKTMQKEHFDPTTIEEVDHQVTNNGFVLLRTGVLSPWLLGIISMHFGSIRGGSFWDKYFEVIYDPSNPTPGRSLARTATEFPLHTDGSFETNPPKYIALQCIQNDVEGFGVSVLVDSWKLIPQLSDDSRAVLEKSSFLFSRFSSGKEVRAFSPILKSQNGQFIIRYRNDRNFTLTPPDDRARVALAEFHTLLNSPDLREEIFLMPGDILVVDNQRLLHGRTALSGKKRRVLRRLWIE